MDPALSFVWTLNLTFIWTLNGNLPLDLENLHLPLRRGTGDDHPFLCVFGGGGAWWGTRYKPQGAFASGREDGESVTGPSANALGCLRTRRMGICQLRLVCRLPIE